MSMGRFTAVIWQSTKHPAQISWVLGPPNMSSNWWATRVALLVVDIEGLSKPSEVLEQLMYLACELQFLMERDRQECTATNPI